MTARGASDFHYQRSWPVWSNHVQHQVDVEISLITDGLRIFVDGSQVESRSGWKVALGTSEIPFEVDGRPCLLVLRQDYGASPAMDIYSEGRSIATGAPLDARRTELGRALPSLIRMLLVFLPIIGVPTTLRSVADADDPVAAWVGAIVVAAGVGIAVLGGWVASRWYAMEPNGQWRQVVGGLIVAAAYLGFFAVFALAFSLGRE